MKLAHTRRMVSAALAGELDGATFRKDPVFGFDVPTAVPDVPAALLDPRGTWPDPAAYDAQAAKLARMFADNFATFAAGVDADVAAAGPATV
jgi:phosphoenolpyruvate carboxykinase (ATP)